MGPEPDVSCGAAAVGHGVKQSLVLILIVVFEVLGNACLSHGMRQIGAIDVGHPGVWWVIGLRVLANPWVVLGIAVLLLYFVCYVTALSRMDLSYVLPVTASNYVLTAVIAWLVLGERLSTLRWLGTAAIGAGLALVRRSDPPLAQRLPPEEAAPRALAQQAVP